MNGLLYYVFTLCLHFRVLQTTNEQIQPPVEAATFVPLSTLAADPVPPTMEVPSPTAKASSPIVGVMASSAEVPTDPTEL